MLRRIAVFPVVALAVLQAWPLLYGRYTWNLASIEPAYIFQAKVMSESFLMNSWNPLWYGGHPEKLLYQPAFLFTTVLSSYLVGGDIVRGYRILTFIAIILLPAALYMLVYSLTKSVKSSMLSSIFLISAPSLHGWIYQQPYNTPLHITVIALYGETPHILGLGLALITVALFHRACKEESKLLNIITPVLMALVMLTNLIAAVSMFVLLTAYSILDEPRAVKKLITYTILAYLLSIFTYDTEYINSLLAYSVGTGGAAITVPTAALTIITLGITYAIAKTIQTRLNNQLLAYSFLLLMIFMLVALINKMLNIFLLPQPVRYGPEIDIQLAMLVSTIITIPKPSKDKWKKITPIAITLVILLISYSYQLPQEWKLLRSGDKTIENSPEYKVAKELEKLLDNRFSPRAYATGSIAFWLNNFAEIPQLRGGYDVAGSRNPLWNHIVYLVNTNPNETLSTLWLKAYNIKYIAVDTPQANTPYKDYLHPEKFQKLKKIKDIDGVIIYEIPLENEQPIQLIKNMDEYPVINNVLDMRNLLSYLELTRYDSEAKLSYSIISDNLIDIEIKHLEKNHNIIFKSNYDPRWTLIANGKEIKPEKIGPNFMLFRINNLEGEHVRLTLKYSNDIVSLSFDTIAPITFSILFLYLILTKRKLTY